MKKTKQIWQKYLEDLCWNNFCESGSIGDYLLYSKIKREKQNERKFIDYNKCNSIKNCELPRK